MNKEIEAFVIQNFWQEIQNIFKLKPQIFTTTFEYLKGLEPNSQKLTINHRLSAALAVSPSEHLIFDSQQNPRLS